MKLRIISAYEKENPRCIICYKDIKNVGAAFEIKHGHGEKPIICIECAHKILVKYEAIIKHFYKINQLSKESNTRTSRILEDLQIIKVSGFETIDPVGMKHNVKWPIEDDAGGRR